MVLDAPTGRNADFDWCLAFGEGGKRITPEEGEDKTAKLQLPRTAFKWPSAGFTSAPAGHDLYSDKKVSEWGKHEWENQGKWEALSWEERRHADLPVVDGHAKQHDTVTVMLPEGDGFARMLTQYMQKPWQCPVHTLKLALMKAGLDVEERMNDSYDVLFLLVRGDDEVLERHGRKLAEAGRLMWKRTLVRPPSEHEVALTTDKVNQMAPDGCCRGWNPCRDEYLENDLYNFTTAGESAAQGQAVYGADATTWGFAMGMVDYDPDLTHRFEDRRLNHYLYTNKDSYDKSGDDYKKFPHPRHFHSGERQELVKAIMENVEWARYLPTEKTAPDGSLEKNHLVYPNVRLTPAAQEEICLMDTVAFGYPTEVTGSRRNQEMLGAMSFLRCNESPVYSVVHGDDTAKVWDGEVPSIKKIICGSAHAEEAEQLEDRQGQHSKSWQDLDTEDQRRAKKSNEDTARRRLTVYPFMVDQCERLGSSAKARNKIDEDVGKARPQYALTKYGDKYEVHHFKKDPFFESVLGPRSYRSLDDFNEQAATEGRTGGTFVPDKVREQQTFLVDCFPLHCPYERAYLEAEFASWRKLCSADVLSLPLDRIEGYFGSGAALYFAWLRCYTKALIVPGLLGLILQLAVWSDGQFPGSVNVLQGWLIAYCVFCALWSSLFMLDWKRRQHKLQYRWGLDNVEANAQPRKEFLEQLHLENEAKVEGETENCLRVLWQCDRPVEVINPMGKVEVEYNSIWMHYARQILAFFFVVIGAFIVMFTSLGILLMRARGMNLVAGSASAWTSLSYIDNDLELSGNVNDVFVEFWTVFDNTCLALDDCSEPVAEGSTDLVYGFAASKHKSNTSDPVARTYTWRTSSEIIVRQVPKIIDRKALLVSGAAVSDALLPRCDAVCEISVAGSCPAGCVDNGSACTGSATGQLGLERVCCTAADFDDVDASVRCWTEGKQKFADGLVQDLGTSFVDVEEMDVSTLAKRSSDDMLFYFRHASLGDCSDHPGLAACGPVPDCESCVYTYTSSSGVETKEVFSSKRSTSAVAALPYAMIQGRQSKGDLSESVLSGLTAPQKLVFADEDPFAEAIELGYCETLSSSNVRNTLRDHGVDTFSDTIGAQPLGHGCLFADHSSFKSYTSLDTDIGLTDAYEFVNAVEPPPELPRRVPLYEPSCNDLKALVVDSRVELERTTMRGDQTIKITTDNVHIHYDSDSEGNSTRATVWQSYRSFAPYIKASVALFSHKYPSGVGGPKFCEVYDANQIENECTLRRFTSRADCEGAGGTWLGVISNQEEIGNGDGVETELALYTRLPDKNWGNGQVWFSTFISVLACQVYGIAWNRVANWLNRWENHRTQIEFEDFMIRKQFVFQFINYYFLLLYIAFLKSGAPFAPFMGANAAAFDSSSSFALAETVQNSVVRVSDLAQVPVVSLRDTCTLDENNMPDCMSELCMQLISLFVFKAIFLQLLESCLPAISAMRSRDPDKPRQTVNQSADSVEDHQTIEDHQSHSKWLHYNFKLPKYGNNAVGGCFQDFNEMVVQFGFMSLFAVGFPGAAFFALVNNIQEMRADGIKIVCQHQRAPIELREDIGAWETVLSFISYIAVITNAVILGFTSQVIYEMFYEDGIEPIVRSTPAPRHECRSVTIRHCPLLSYSYEY